jgi:hypothetical protein
MPGRLHGSQLKELRNQLFFMMPEASAQYPDGGGMLRVHWKR